MYVFLQVELGCFGLVAFLLSRSCLCNELLRLREETLGVLVPVVGLLQVFLLLVKEMVLAYDLPRHAMVCSPRTADTHTDDLIYHRLEVLGGAEHERVNTHIALTTDSVRSNNTM